MTGAPRPTSGKRIGRAARDERLARALRDNLRRRKEQSRAQQQIRAGEPALSDPSPSPQGGGKPPA
jgi:hypothetical protein